MSARTWWSAKADPKPAENRDDRASESPDLPIDELLDARFDDEGRLAQLGRGGRQRIAERLDPRPAETSVEELDLAVQKLSEGLEAIERQSQGRRAESSSIRPETLDSPAAEPSEAGGDRDFVTYSLDRLEARLEALSRRLQQRTGTGATAPAETPPGRRARRSDPSLAVAPEEERAAQLAESRRLADAEEDRRAATEAAERSRQVEAAAQSRLEAEQARVEAERARRDAEQKLRAAEAAVEEERRRQTEIAAEIAEARREAAAADARRRSEVAEARRQSELAEARRQVEVTEARRQAEMAEARRRVEAEASADERRREAEDAAEKEEVRQAEVAAEIAEAKREAEAADARRRSEVAEARRQSELAEARRQTEVTEARHQAELAEARRLEEAEAAAEERQRVVQEAETIRLADLTEARRNAEAAEARHRAEAEEAQRQAEIAAARREAELAAVLERQFSEIEGRIDGLQKGLDENQIEPVREELLELVQQISELSRGGRATSGALDEIGIRLDQMEMKLNAARNMAGNRLGDIQDRLSGLVERLDEIEVEIPGFDAIRVNQSAILERFDRMEGLVHRLSSPEELFERVDGLKRQMQTVASQREVARIEEQILRLAERLDALPDDLSDKDVLGRIEDQLGALAAEFTEARRQRKSVANELEDHLSELSAQLRDVAETGRTPDLSGLEERVSGLASQVAEDRIATGDTLARLERRLGALTDAIENQEDDAAAGLLESLTHKINSLADAIDAQDAPGARRDVEGLGRRLDLLGEHIAEQAEHLSRRQLDPLADRLAAIEDRIAALSSRATDPRALQAQIEGIVSRLELLKGRSIDPARLNDLFDRVDAAVRAFSEERFDRLEQRLEETIAPAERFDRLERRIAEATAGAANADRFSGLERKLDEIGRVFTAGGELLTQEDLTELRSDMVALRRELRSLPGHGDASLGDLIRTLVTRLEQLPQDAPATVADLEAQIQRIARILEDPGHGRLPLAHIETSLRTIEERLEETRRSLDRSTEQGDPDAETQAVAGLARALSDDVTVLKSSAQASERKTRDAIDAVQDTLEAVVKRMAFLERDADAAMAAAERPPVETRSAEPPPPLPSAPEPEPPAIELEPVAQRDLSDPAPASLLSRLTSRQLLKRATGGRAESFSPESEEADDASDFPLEPGTDAPLSSALTGAPSSNTEFMSGARRGRLTQPFDGDVKRQGATGRAEPQPAADDDFLAAARRAARAASREVTDSDGSSPLEQRSGGFFKAHRRALLAAAIAAALIIAAFPLLRTQFWPGETDIAALPDASAPVEPEPPLRPEESTPTAFAPEPTATPPEVAAPETAGEVEPRAIPGSDLLPVESESAATDLSEDEKGATTLTSPAVETPSAMPEEPATSEPDVAAIAPSATPETDAAAPAAPGMDASAPTPEAAETQAAPPALPESIGPTKLRDAAMAGDTGAAFEVAARYAEGRGVLPDMPTAVSWYARAAEAGLAPAQYRLGSIYEKGLGVPKDLTAAQKWYGLAADAGNVKAMHNLAVLYAEGAGGAPDLEKASGLFRQAAEHGVRDSQFNLAILHARGLGVPQDLVEAYKWFGIAASSGDEESAKRRDIIGEALSPRDKARAEEAVATFQPIPLDSAGNEVLLPEGGWSDGENSTSVDLRDQNELVALVQKLLAENGYDPGPADGLLGSKTIEAISAFQAKAGLPKTGEIDAGLMAALQAPST